MGGFIIGMKKGWGNENSAILEEMEEELIVPKIEEREGNKRFLYMDQCIILYI